MKFMVLVFFAFLPFASTHAQLQKCTESNGKVTYSDTACNNNSTAAVVKNPNGNTIANSRNESTNSRCEAATKEYRTAIATKPQYVKNIPLMPEYIAMNTHCAQSNSNARESVSSRDESGCAAALAEYKRARAAKTHYVNQIKFMPEYIAMNAKCGTTESKQPSAHRHGILTREIVEGNHTICIYSNGSSISIAGLAFCAASN